jgi:hypothetical protein
MATFVLEIEVDAEDRATAIDIVEGQLENWSVHVLVCDHCYERLPSTDKRSLCRHCLRPLSAHNSLTPVTYQGEFRLDSLGAGQFLRSAGDGTGACEVGNDTDGWTRYEIGDPIPHNADYRDTCPKCDGPLDSTGYCFVNHQSPNADTGGYHWDWLNSDERPTGGETYIVRTPAGVVFCYTNRYKDGYEAAVAIAEAMNARVSPNDRSDS